jgi:hypothetical protein
MRTLNDPELNKMANELRTLQWVGSLLPDELAACQSAEETVIDPQAKNGLHIPKRRLVHPLPGWSSWAVRIYLGGGQRTIGIVGHKDLAAGLRYADMAMMHFWKYKVRGACPPGKMELNLTTDRLEADMANETFALDLLRRQEEYLLSVGILKSSEQRATEEKSRRQSMRKGFLRTTVSVQHLETLEKFEAVQNQIAEAQATLLARIDRLDDSLTKVLAALLQRQTVYTPPVVVPPYGVPEQPFPQPGPGWPVSPGPTTGNPTTIC